MSFSAEIDAFAKKVRQNKQEVAAAFLLKLNELSVLRTPVDTGRARGGWVASIDNLPATIGNPDKTGSTTLNRINGVALMAVGRVYFLANNVKYITILEYGGYKTTDSEKVTNHYSRQAPHGMVRISIEELRNYINEFKPV